MKTMKDYVIFALLLLTLTVPAHGLTLGSYNIRNFDYDERSNTPTNKAKLASIFQEMNADLVGVQEINEPEIFKEFLSRYFNGERKAALSTCGGGGDQKLGFVYNPSKLKLISFQEDLSVSNPYSPGQGLCDEGSRPLAVATFKSLETGETFVAFSVHLKAGGHQSAIKKRFRQLSIVQERLSELRSQGQQNFVVLGDFNTTEYSESAQGKKAFQKSVKKMNLLDVSANLSCTSYWWGGRPDGKQYPSQLDHILVSPNFGKAKEAKARAYGHCAQLACSIAQENNMGVSFDEVSDHCPIAASI